MKRMTQFFDEKKDFFGISYQTFFKYVMNNANKFEKSLKIINNSKRKSFWVYDEQKFIEDFFKA